LTRFHIGTMGWSYKFWSGNFYPKTLKSDGFLKEYSAHFDSVEVDNTFYRIPDKSTITKWRSQVPGDFLFSAKFPRTITHVKMLENSEEVTNFFIERISELQGNLGPLLLQFPPNFGSERLPLLKDFVGSLPKRFRFAVEVRNASLLDNRLYSILRDNGIALVCVAKPSTPAIEEITSDFLYLRWEGDRKTVNGTLGKVEIDRVAEIKKWAKKIQGSAASLKDVFGYFSKYYSGHPPSDAKKLLGFLAKRKELQN
jgi:uncharacterized protein YecE (DUF72 family)